MASSWYRLASGEKRLTLTVHVQPGAKATCVAGLHGDALKIRLAAPPAEGRANDELARFLAVTFGVPLRQVRIMQGSRSRRKIVEVIEPRAQPESLLKGG